MVSETDFEKIVKIVLKQPKKKFKQRIEMVIGLKDVNLKKPEEKIDDYLVLSKSVGKEHKICALIGKELVKTAKENTDFHILSEDFTKFSKDAKGFKKIVRKYDFFIAQANVMPLIAKNFGKYLGSKGKMPNPKFGQIVPNNVDLKPIVARFKKMILLQTKSQPNIQVPIGNEEMKEEDIVKNAFNVYEKIVQTLPRGTQQIKQILIKTSMGKPVKLGEEA